MNPETSDQTNRTNQEQAQQASRPETTDQAQSNRQWLNVPDGLTTWLTKRVEFALPVCAVAVASIVLAFLVFD